MVVSKDTQMRPWGQCIPQAPRTAHGQMNFVVFAPVCLFPVLPPARQFANPSSRPRSGSWIPISEVAHLDEVGSGAIVNNNSTALRFRQVVVEKLQAEHFQP